jgi:hypothetical protein
VLVITSQSWPCLSPFLMGRPRERSQEFQCIVISLKDMFYENANGLIGICRDVASNGSRTLTLDLDQYDDPTTDQGHEEVSRPQAGKGGLANLGFVV